MFYLHIAFGAEKVKGNINRGTKVMTNYDNENKEISLSTGRRVKSWPFRFKLIKIIYK